MSAATPVSRFVSDAGADDVVIPFAVTPLDVRGRLVRLGPALDILLGNHGYPADVARAVGEAAALTALLGTALKFEGRFQLQTRTDGVIDMLVVDFDAPDRLRAFARFDAEKLEAARAAGNATPAGLLGKGHLAFTIDQGADMSRYQGLVALEGQGLEAAAHEYFLRSEQIPTLVRLAVGEILGAGATGHWRAGGLIVQFLPIRRNAAAWPICRRVTLPRARRSMNFARMTHGQRRARLPQPWKTTSSSIRTSRASVCSIGFSTNAA